MNLHGQFRRAGEFAFVERFDAPAEISEPILPVAKRRAVARKKIDRLHFDGGDRVLAVPGLQLSVCRLRACEPQGAEQHTEGDTQGSIHRESYDLGGDARLTASLSVTSVLLRLLTTTRCRMDWRSL